MKQSSSVKRQRCECDIQKREEDWETQQPQDCPPVPLGTGLGAGGWWQDSAVFGTASRACRLWYVSRRKHLFDVEG